MPTKTKTEYGASFKADFQERFAFLAATTKTFSQRTIEHMAKRDWNAEIFINKTALNLDFYYKLSNSKVNKPKLETALNICIGLRLNKWERNELIELAGYTLRNELPDAAYIFILDNCDIRNIDDFNNAFLALELKGYSTPPLKSDR